MMGLEGNPAREAKSVHSTVNEERGNLDDSQRRRQFRVTVCARAQVFLAEIRPVFPQS